jgi:hypothetical protein
MTASSRAAGVHCRGLPLPSLAAKAAARQRSNVATLMPTFCEMASSDELSGGSKRATTASLNFCP